MPLIIDEWRYYSKVTHDMFTWATTYIYPICINVYIYEYMCIRNIRAGKIETTNFLFFIGHFCRVAFDICLSLCIEFVYWICVLNLNGNESLLWHGNCGHHTVGQLFYKTARNFSIRIIIRIQMNTTKKKKPFIKQNFNHLLKFKGTPQLRISDILFYFIRKFKFIQNLFDWKIRIRKQSKAYAIYNIIFQATPPIHFWN